MMKTFAAIMLATAASAARGDIADTLLIGDSFHGYSGETGAANYIQTYCTGKVFKNRAISGSTAK